MMKLVINNKNVVGRNDPCPCGSGKKYKQCCLQKDEVALKSARPEEIEDDLEPLPPEVQALFGEIERAAEEAGLSLEEFLEIHGEDLRERFVEAAAMDDEDVDERDQAIALIYEAMDVEPGPERRGMIEEALSLYPLLPDGWIMLAEDSRRDPKRAIELYRKAVHAGEFDLGEDFFKAYRGHFWGMTESRPYMRAKVILALALWEAGEEVEAIQHLKDCLRLNPDDNQGVRYTLIPWLLIKGDLASVETYFKKYKEATFTPFAYSRALFLFMKSGPANKPALNQLKKAFAANKLVPLFLLGKKKLPKKTPEYYSPGSQEEAIVYYEESARAWREAAGALDWLRESFEHWRTI